MELSGSFVGISIRNKINSLILRSLSQDCLHAEVTVLLGLALHFAKRVGELGGLVVMALFVCLLSL